MVRRRGARSMLGVGIIGCGAMGRAIATAIDDGTIPNVQLTAAFDQYIERVEELYNRLKSKFSVKRSFDEFIESKNLDLVVEAASQRAVKEYGVKILRKGKDLLIMSIGALLNAELYSEIYTTSRRYGGKVYLISGALAGIDGVRAAKIAGLDEVVLTTRKNPRSLAGSPYLKERGIDVEGIGEPLLLYEGPALEAVKHFPANVNVAATLSIAGLGAEKTKVKVIADPTITRNIHEVSVRGRFGEMTIIMQNVPHPSNPRSSYLAALSAIETIRSIAVTDIRVGT